MEPIRRWIAFTCRKNPAFPLSTLLLVTGLWLLSGETEADAANLLGIAAGLGVVGAFLGTLIGLAAFVLWPRRVHYETASALRVFCVFRYALPFVVTSYAVDGGNPVAALLLGLAVVGFVGGSGELAVRRIGLRAHASERRLDWALYSLAAIVFPLLAHGLAVETGEALSFGAARGLAIAAWWVLALLLLPLTFGLGTIVPAGPLRSRLPALTWRAVTLIALPALLWHALWTGGQEAPLVAYLPLALVAQLALARGGESLGRPLAGWIAYAPAATLALTLALPEPTLLGRVPALSQPLAVLCLAPLAAGAAALLCPTRLKHSLGAVGAVVAASPLTFMASWHEAAAYLLLAGLVVTLVGLVRRDAAIVAHGAILAVACGTALCERAGVSHAAPALAGALGVGSLLALKGFNRTSLAWVAGLLLAVPWAQGMTSGLGDPVTLGLFPVCALLVVSAWAGGRAPLIYAAGACGASYGLRLSLPLIGPGVLLVALGFAGLPLGSWIGIRRERAREALA